MNTTKYIYFLFTIGIALVLGACSSHDIATFYHHGYPNIIQAEKINSKTNIIRIRPKDKDKVEHLKVVKR